MRRFLGVALLAAVAGATGPIHAQTSATSEPAPASVETSGVRTPTSPSMRARTTGPIGYDLRMQELQGGLDELRDDVYRSRSRLFLLREQVLQDTLGGAQTIIKHVNDLGNGFRIVGAVYSLDGTQIYSASEETIDLHETKEIEIHRGSVLPGAHNLSVQLTIEGKVRGPFAYTRAYRFTVTTSHAFTVDAGQTIELDAIGYPLKGIDHYVERPQVRFHERRVVSRDAIEQDQQAQEQ